MTTMTPPLMSDDSASDDSDSENEYLLDSEEEEWIQAHLYEFIVYKYPVMRKIPFTLSQMTRALVKDHLKTDLDIENLPLPSTEKSALKHLKP